MKAADMAMYKAKDGGKNNFRVYSNEMNSVSLERFVLEEELRSAIERNEFRLDYQAKVDVRTGRVTGLEALVRWVHPVRGMVSPVDFIPIAEETGLIVALGKWVLRTACEQTVLWHKAGHHGLQIAVNLSARQFGDEQLLPEIQTVLDDTGLAPACLELEITESLLMQDVGKAMHVLTSLRAIGVRFAMDDFGTGYSSLSTLKRFPLNTLKIDRSFIRDLPGDADDCAITQAIISMGRSLGLKVVAEGVETKEQADFLGMLGCDELQGYLFSRPLQASKVSPFLRDFAQRSGAPEAVSSAVG
jgi:EAL domain-containing protein (putative c-di-GMP-specific phosphodiesterase class I)